MISVLQGLLNLYNQDNYKLDWSYNLDDFSFIFDLFTHFLSNDIKTFTKESEGETTTETKTEQEREKQVYWERERERDLIFHS